MSYIEPLDSKSATAKTFVVALTQKERGMTISNKDYFKSAIREEWHKITPKITKKPGTTNAYDDECGSECKSQSKKVLKLVPIWLVDRTS